MKKLIIAFLLLSLTGCLGVDTSNENGKWELSSEYGKGERKFELTNVEFLEGKEDKRMWVFYNKNDFFDKKKLIVKGQKQGSDKEQDVLIMDMTPKGNWGSTPTKLVSSFALPSKGRWKLKVDVDEESYGYLIVDVK